MKSFTARSTTWYNFDHDKFAANGYNIVYIDVNFVHFTDGQKIDYIYCRLTSF